LKVEELEMGEVVMVVVGPGPKTTGPAHVYEEYIRQRVQRKPGSLRLLVEGDEFLFNKYWLLQWE
jgi:hypothetical protein